MLIINDRFKDFREGMYKKGFNVDSTSSFEKSLTGKIAKVQETIYSESIAQSAFPLAASLGSGLTSIEYYTAEATGEMGLIGPKSQDLPHMDEHMTRDEKPVANYGGTFGWSFLEFERANRQGYEFSGRRARNARKSSERTLDRNLLSEGDPQKPSVKGVFGYQMSTVSGLTGNWLTATNDQITSDVGKILQAAYTGSGGEYPATHMMVGALNFGILKYRLNPQTDKSLKVTLEEQFEIKIIRSKRLDSVTSATNSLSAAPTAIAYNYDMDIAEVNIPRPFMMRPGEWRGNKYCVDCYLDFAGFFNYLPSSFAVADLS